MGSKDSNCSEVNFFETELIEFCPFGEIETIASLCIDLFKGFSSSGESLPKNLLFLITLSIWFWCFLLRWADPVDKSCTRGLYPGELSLVCFKTFKGGCSPYRPPLPDLRCGEVSLLSADLMFELLLDLRLPLSFLYRFIIELSGSAPSIRLESIWIVYSSMSVSLSTEALPR